MAIVAGSALLVDATPAHAVAKSKPVTPVVSTGLIFNPSVFVPVCKNATVGPKCSGDFCIQSQTPAYDQLFRDPTQYPPGETVSSTDGRTLRNIMMLNPSTTDPNSLLCGPTSGAMVLQGMLNYYPCNLNSTSNLNTSFIGKTSQRKVYYEFLNMGTAPHDMQQTVTVGFNTPLGTLSHDFSFTGSGTTSWGADNGVKNMKSHFSGGIGDSNALSWLLTAQSITDMVNWMKAGYLQILNYGHWYEKTWNFAIIHVRYYSRDGGHYIAPVGYQRVYDGSEEAANPYVFFVNDPWAGTRISHTAHGEMGFNLSCGCHWAWFNTTCSCDAVVPPAFPWRSARYVTNYPDPRGHYYGFIESYSTLGINQ